PSRATAVPRPRTTTPPATAPPAGPEPTRCPPRRRPSSPAANPLRGAGPTAPAARAACARGPARQAGPGSSAQELRPAPHQPPVGGEPFTHSIERVFETVKRP